MASFERLLERRIALSGRLRTDEITELWIGEKIQNSNTDKYIVLRQKLNALVESGELKGEKERTPKGYAFYYVYREDFEAFLKKEKMWPLDEDSGRLREWWPLPKPPTRNQADPYEAARQYAQDKAKAMWAQGDTRTRGALASVIRDWIRAGIGGFELPPTLPTTETIKVWIEDYEPAHLRGKPGRPRKE